MASKVKSVRKIGRTAEKLSESASKEASKVGKVKAGSLKKVDTPKSESKNLPVVAKPVAGGGGNGVKPPKGYKAYKNASEVGPRENSPVVKARSGGVPAKRVNRNSMLEEAKVVTGSSSKAGSKVESSASKAAASAEKDASGRFKKMVNWGKEKLKGGKDLLKKTAAAKAIKAQGLVRKNKKVLKKENLTGDQKNAVNKGIGKEKSIRNENLKKVGKRAGLVVGGTYLYNRDKKQKKEIESLKKQVEEAKRRPQTQNPPQQSTPAPSNTPERKEGSTNNGSSRSGGSSSGRSSSGRVRVPEGYTQPSRRNGTYSGSSVGGPGRGRRSVESVKAKESGKTDRYIAKQEGKTARTKIRADRSAKRQEQKTIRQTNRQNKKTERQAKRQNRRSNRRGS